MTEHWDAEKAWKRSEEAEKRRQAYWRARKRETFWENVLAYGSILVAGAIVIWLLTIPYLP